MTEPPHLRTRVGRAERDRQPFCGRDAFSELAGSANLRTLIGLAVGIEPLPKETQAILDDMVACAAAADPHIWPLKLARLAASYGDAVTGFCAANQALAVAPIGMSTSQRCARLLRKIKRESEATGKTTRAVLARRRAIGERFDGFGVPFRSVDERVVALRRRLDARGFGGDVWWPLAEEIEASLAGLGGPSLNIAGAVAAICLDLGLDEGQIQGISFINTLAPLLANAWEGAEQSAEVLQRLPRKYVRYVGPAPRRSPRAQGSS